MNYQYSEINELRESNPYIEHYIRAAKVVSWLELEFGIEDQRILDTIFNELFVTILEDIENFEKYNQVAINIYNEMKGDIDEL